MIVWQGQTRNQRQITKHYYVTVWIETKCPQTATANSRESAAIWQEFSHQPRSRDRAPHANENMPDATRGDPTSVEGSALYLGATFDDKRSDVF